MHRRTHKHTLVILLDIAYHFYFTLSFSSFMYIYWLCHANCCFSSQLWSYEYRLKLLQALFILKLSYPCLAVIPSGKFIQNKSTNLLKVIFPLLPEAHWNWPLLQMHNCYKYHKHHLPLELLKLKDEYDTSPLHATKEVKQLTALSANHDFCPLFYFILNLLQKDEWVLYIVTDLFKAILGNYSVNTF